MQKSIRRLREELLAAGFAERQGKGSHRVFTHPSGATISLPVQHLNRDGRGLIQRVEHTLRKAQAA